MSETVEDKLASIQVDYNVCCAKVGELSYTLHCVQAEIQKLYAEIKKYQQTAKKLLEKQQASQASEKAKVAMAAQVPDAPQDPVKL